LVPRYDAVVTSPLKDRVATAVGAISGKGLFAVVVWGASFVATRVALQAVHPFALISIRLWMGTGLLGLVLAARRERLLPRRADLAACIFLGVVLSAHLLVQAFGLEYTSAINTGWIIGFIPVTIALGATLLRQQRLSGLGWLGVAVGTGGVLVVTLKSPPNFAQARIGDLLQLISCLTWTVYTLAATGPNQRNGVLRVTTFGMAVAAAIGTLAAFFRPWSVGPLKADAVLAIAFLGVICSGAAYYLWFAAQRDYGPAHVGALLYIEPFVGLIVAASLLHEPVTINALVGGVCVLAGVWLVARGAIKPEAGSCS
jgi:drug/metabolite transporter (DMT)-like permease